MFSSPAMTEWDELSFKLVRLETAGQEVLAKAGNILVARACIRHVRVTLWKCRNRVTASFTSHLLIQARLKLRISSVVLF
jgi:hypothetical protein